MSISFLATIPNVQSSLKFGADEARVTFEVPKSEVEHAVALIALKGAVLKITVEVAHQSKPEGMAPDASTDPYVVKKF